MIQIKHYKSSIGIGFRSFKHTQPGYISNQLRLLNQSASHPDKALAVVCEKLNAAVWSWWFHLCIIYSVVQKKHQKSENTL